MFPLVSFSVWPLSLLEAGFLCYSSTALAGGYSCVTPLCWTVRMIIWLDFAHSNSLSSHLSLRIAQLV